MQKFKNIDDYIFSFSENIQEIMNKIQNIIIKKLPNIESGISYGMPSFKINGKILVYFAGYKNHIGFYATPTGHEKFKDKLLGYKQGKGSVQFPLDKPIPFDLIEQIVDFRIKEILVI